MKDGLGMTVRNAAGVLMVLACWAMTMSAQAADQPVMYEAVVPVASQALAERDAALGKALIEVLVRVSGQQAAAAHPGLQPVIKDAARLVLQYRYQGLSVRSDEPWPSPQPDADMGTAAQADTQTGNVAGDDIGAVPIQEMPIEEVPGIGLWVSFDPQAVQNALQDAGLPVWGPERPTTLAWIAIDAGSEHLLAGSDAPATVLNALQDTARQRGVPLLLPLQDLEDQAALNYADVWGGLNDVIEQASARYAPDGVLSARVYEAGLGQWVGQWRLSRAGAVSEWQSDGADVAAVLADGIGRLADVVLGGDSEPIQEAQGTRTPLRLQVSGITSIDQYAAVERHLARLTPVVSVKPVQLEPSRAQFEVMVRGNPGDFEQALAFAALLSVDTAAARSAAQSTGAGPGATLYYRIAR